MCDSISNIQNTTNHYKTPKGITKNTATAGDDETFYLHCLRFYIPRIAQITFDEDHLGVGIFTMQGFERRNKESKNIFKRFSNGKGNVLVPNMKRLYDIFENNY